MADSTFVQLLLPDEILSYLNQVEMTGLYGRGLNEVVLNLVIETLRRKLEADLFRLARAAVIGDDEDPEKPLPSPSNFYTETGPNCAHTRESWPVECDAEGCLGDELPF